METKAGHGRSYWKAESGGSLESKEFWAVVYYVDQVKP